MYEILEDAQLRLNRCVILHNCLPVYVHGIGRDPAGSRRLLMSISRLPQLGEREMVDITDAGFDCRNMRLGYLNHTKYGAAYLSRIPARRQRQGLYEENVSIKHAYLRWGDVLTSDGVLDMFRGVYPTLKGCIDKALSDAPAKHHPYDEVSCLDFAFHRYFAVRQDMRDLLKLYYKGNKVAYTTGGSTVFTFEDKFKHLREVAEEAGVTVR